MKVTTVASSHSELQPLHVSKFYLAELTIVKEDIMKDINEALDEALELGVLAPITG